MWKDIPGYEGLYQANTNGQIKRLAKRIKGKSNSTKLIKEMILAPAVAKDGYSNPRLTNAQGKRSTVKAHRLIALTFIPNPENKPFVNHKDGNRLNNKVSNLEWVTNAENIRHAYRVNVNQVKQIRELINKGLTDQEIVDQL